MKDPTIKFVLLLSNADNSGGIAYNLEAIRNRLVAEGGEAVWHSLQSTKLFSTYCAFKKSDLVISTSLKTLFYSSLFRLFSLKPIKVIQVVYHPSFADASISIFRLAVRVSLRVLGKKNILYYCDEALYRTNLEPYDKNRIIGLMSEDVASEESNCAPNVLSMSSGVQIKMSTVSRFVSFKYGYLCGLIDYVKENKSVSLNIVGFGPMEGLLKERSCNHDRIKFFGKLSRNDSLSVVAGSALYVGMGTTLLDATWLGVPALIAEESESQACCHGFFHEHQGISYGEKSSRNQRYSLNEYIDKYLKMSPIEKSLLKVAAVNKRENLRKTKTHKCILSSSFKSDYFTYTRACNLLFSIAIAYILKCVSKKDYK